jgi:tRNA modification GTPase
VEAALDFADDGDVAEQTPQSRTARAAGEVADAMEAVLARPPVERLREGVRVAIAGPPNSGKSSLFNRLVQREAAIISAVAGTTRDLIEAPVAIGGTPFLLIDTAGVRETSDEVEIIGVERAHEAMKSADLVLWLGPADQAPAIAVRVHSKCDLKPAGADADIAVSSLTGEGVDALAAVLLERAKLLLPGRHDLAINARHRTLIAQCRDCLREAEEATDPLLAAEALRQARAALDRITGRAGVEEMLDALFGRFCIGK